MVLRFADCRLDLRRRELSRAGVVVAVEPQVFDLIALLIAERRRVVTREELTATIWGGRIVSESTIDSRVSAARAALGDDGRSQRLIRTLRKRGLRFVAEVAGDVEEIEASGAQGAPCAQRVVFLRSRDGVRIAAAEIGSGPTLIKAANWLTHLERDWSSPVWAPTLRRLARGRRLVRYDSRGVGLSERAPERIDFESFVQDFETAADACGARTFSVFGMSQGAAVALAYAARHPERVERLVLLGAYALGRGQRARIEERALADGLLTLMRLGWGKEDSPFMRAFSTLYLPHATPEQVGWFCDLQRATASGLIATRIRAACDDIDVRELASKVVAPTLVLHSRGDGVVPFAQGREVAAALPRSRLVALDSANHIILPQEPAWNRFMLEVERFLH